MRVLPFVVAVSLLAACAVYSGVVQTGTDTYFLSRQAATGFSGRGKLKAEVLREAGAHCAKLGRELEVLSVSEAEPPFILGNFPKAEVEFQCLAKEEG